MNCKQLSIALAFGLLAATQVSAQQTGATVPDVPGLPTAASAAAAQIDGEKIRAHVQFLSLDLLEGRGPGTRGAELAAEYIATQFALAGVEPAGDNGTYFQKVPLLAVHTIEDKTKFSFVPAAGQAVDLAYGTEIVSKDQTGQPTADLDAPIVFVGRDLASYGWEVVRNSQAVEKSYLQGDPDATLRAAAWIQHDVAQRLFTLAGMGDLDQAIEQAGKPGAFHAVELPVKLRAHIESRVRRYVSSNVVGRVSGASAEDQAVLYTAHYDHLGIDPDAKGDNIYNGAADNGTGCGILLELARALAQSPVRPPHGLFFRGHGGGAGTAWLAVSGHASAGACRADFA